LQPIVAGIRRITSADGPDIILWGSSTLTSTLLEHELTDEIVLIVYPVLLGTGERFFGTGSFRPLSARRRRFDLSIAQKQASAPNWSPAW
jgi:dihydrofolate reductase